MSIWHKSQQFDIETNTVFYMLLFITYWLSKESYARHFYLLLSVITERSLWFILRCLLFSIWYPGTVYGNSRTTVRDVENGSDHR